MSNLANLKNNFLKNFYIGDTAEMGTFQSACYHLSYSLYGDMNPQILYENYGPYYINNTGQEYMVVIKEFKNMKPIEIWKDINNLPFGKIRIVSFYQNVNFTIDSITHTNYEGDIINGLKHYSLEVNDRPVDIKEVENLINIIENFAQLIWSVFKKLNQSIPRSSAPGYSLQGRV